MAGEIYLGPAGALVQIPRVRLGPDASRQRAGALHVLAGGGAVMDVTSRRRTYQLTGGALTADQLGVWEQLAELPGPYRLIDTNRRNLLRINQSSGTDALGDTTGFSALTQGTVASSTAQARTRSRSLAWNTVTALGATDRGIQLFTDPATVDKTWTACLPSTQYTFSTYVRASAAVSMLAGISFYNAATPPALLSSPSSGGVAVSTTDWSTRLTFTGTSDATAAYMVPKALNTTTTGAAITVYFDDAQLEQGAAATAAVVGTGTPIVAVDQLTTAYPLPGRYDVEMTLVELS